LPLNYDARNLFLGQLEKCKTCSSMNQFKKDNSTYLLLLETLYMFVSKMGFVIEFPKVRDFVQIKIFDK